MTSLREMVNDPIFWLIVVIVSGLMLILWGLFSEPGKPKP